MKRARLVLALGLALGAVDLVADEADRGNRRGYINNADGEQCWYNQVMMKGHRYMFATLTANTSVMKFDKPGCMRGTGKQGDINKMMINKVISRWYSHKDAKFGTKVDDFRPRSQDQVRGVCLQSAKYPLVSIAVEYVGDGTIEKVFHTSGAGGCGTK